MSFYRRKRFPFGKKLLELGEQHGWNSAADIGTALYENDSCFELVHPRDRDKKHLVNREKDINAITRRVQEHIIPTKEAQGIPGNYMMAYSILFDCSLDYLFGKIDEVCPNAEVADISKKTGLSSKAVANLMSNTQIYLEGFLYQYYQYEFLYSNINPEAYTGVTKFWSDILESNLYIGLPESWTEMACALQLYKATEQQFAERDSKKPTLPSREEFFERVNEYYVTHDHADPCMGDDPYEVYDHDKARVMMIMRDIDNEEWEESSSDREKSKMVYWGCAGMFDRKLGNYFHDLAEHFEIPTFDPYEEDTEEE